MDAEYYERAIGSQAVWYPHAGQHARLSGRALFAGDFGNLAGGKAQAHVSVRVLDNVEAKFPITLFNRTPPD